MLNNNIGQTVTSGITDNGKRIIFFGKISMYSYSGRKSRRCFFEKRVSLSFERWNQDINRNEVLYE